jgi:electron-transferring-flavoprotein dehydrogenase
MGADILPGFPADKLYFNEDGSIGGVITGDFGVGKDGEPKDTFMPGMILKGKQTIFSEGCRGSLGQILKEHFDLDSGVINKQQYGLGVKEIWEVDNEEFKPGLVKHTVNWPLGHKTYGGSFMYHVKPNLVHIGLVVGLDYQNPHINPYEEFQRFKMHKDVKKYLKNGECISYGARALNKGGYHSVPTNLSFKGGMITGCSAGFMNVSEIKGTHQAMKTGMIAGEEIFKKMKDGEDLAGVDLKEYDQAVKSSWVLEDLKKWRNFQLGFKKSLWFGLTHGFFVEFH